MKRDWDIAKKIATDVFSKGGRTFLVGGYVRDQLLGLESKDIDIEVHNIRPDELKSILSKYGKVDTQGVSFGVYKIKGYDIDIAQPRSEKSSGYKHKDFEVTVDPFIGYEKAAMRRDFTMNAIMQDVLTSEIIDPFNGLQDLKQGIIRHVSDLTFVEDPLRVFRAASFAARFNFAVDESTMALMKTMKLSELSKERVFEEVKKALLKSNKPSIFFTILKEANQLSYWFPEIEALIDCPQNPKYHPEGCVWAHTMQVLDKAASVRCEAIQPLRFMLSALCHDLGKPAVCEKIDGVVHAYDHEKKGIPYAKALLSRLTTDKNISLYVENMVKMHMTPHRLFSGYSKVKKTNTMFDSSVCPEDLILLAYADSSDNIRSKNERAFLEERLEAYTDIMKMPEVTGKDLIAIGLKPGEEFSSILNKAHKCHLAGQDKSSVLKGIKTEYL